MALPLHSAGRMGGITLSRKILGGLAILAGSYLVAGLSNSSPITQPPLHASRARGPAVIVVPSPSPADRTEGGPMQADTPEGPGREFQAVAHAPLQKL
jgi:hypothetical protein